VGVKLTAVIPLPLKLTVCGLPLALSVILSVSVLVPSALGVKVTEILQLAPAARVAGLIGQVLLAT